MFNNNGTYLMRYTLCKLLCHCGKILEHKPLYTKAFKDAKGIISCYEDFNNGFKLQQIGTTLVLT